MAQIRDEFLSYAGFNINFENEEYGYINKTDTIADLYNITENKKDIIENMANKIENNRDLISFPYKLIIVFKDHEECNNETEQFFSIYIQDDNIKYEEYLEKGYNVGYGFIRIKIA